MKVNLSTKIISLFVLGGVIPMVAIGILGYYISRSALENQAINQLQGVRQIKKNQIEQFFAERQGDMGVLVETVDTVRKDAFDKLIAVRENKRIQIETYFNDRITLMNDVQMNLRFTGGVRLFSEAFAKGIESAEYKNLCDEKEKGFSVFMNNFKFHDLYLIDTGGNVVYSVGKQSDLGENLANGQLKNSGLARAFEKSKNQIAIEDFSWYEPSNQPAVFIATPIKDPSGAYLGAAAFQISLKDINTIMQERTGMGKTGETYLVGPDKRMRSNSFLDPAGHSVKASFAGTVEKNGVDTDASRVALSGKSGAGVIIDYNGNPVLSAYTPVKIGGVTWALISEIDVAEAFCPVDEEGEYFFAKYTAKYGYYDLFLMNPDGYVFYTVAKEADYQSNMANGKYSSSNLGRLVKMVINAKQFGIADFEPYAPSNNEPAAFIAQPIMNNGKIEALVALQLSLGAINNVMQQREGLGNTGETYLVGSDRLMRSDSFLDPANHSVKASFANPAKGSVKTEASNEALSGKSGAKIITDYNGNPVVSAYAPVKVGGHTWAIIAEIDEAEAFARVYQLRKWMIIIGIASAGFVAGLGILVVRITGKISNLFRKLLAELTGSATQVASASEQISASSQGLSESTSQQAASIEETSSTMEEIASMTTQNADNASEAAKLAKACNVTVENGNHNVIEMDSAMKDISGSSGKIADIIKIIEGIAFQTNLLALNAAVEAARAGEHGRGFAVVAEEVRNLAQRSSAASKDITSLITDSVQKANKGTELVEKTKDAFSGIVVQVKKVTALVNEIAVSSEEQTSGIQQISNAIQQMEQVVQQNAANAEETAAASEELTAQAQGLNELVDGIASEVGMKNDNDKGMEKHVPFKIKERKPLKSGEIASLRSPERHSVQMKTKKDAGKRGGASGNGKRNKMAHVTSDDQCIPLEAEFKDF